MRVVQILPELNAGGVERGTVEFARYLVEAGHDSLVISAGGRLVDQLERQGSQHILMPVHRKRLGSLRQIRPLRQKLLSLGVDVVHVRSRLPAWLTWFAIGRRPRHQRPAVVSTFHGLYSTRWYSTVMGRADAVIAISDCVRRYILSSYPDIPREKIELIHRGVDTRVFNREFRVSSRWTEAFFGQFPRLRDRPLVLMPGRLSRWKGQEAFIALIGALKQRGVDCHGVIVGGPTPGKEIYEQELKQKVSAEGLDEWITFTGHRSDIAEIYMLAAVVCNLSEHPEPFGRTVIEALALGVPAVAYDVGGPAESLQACLPSGLVKPNDLDGLASRVVEFIANPPRFELPRQFTLNEQARKTLGVYERLLSSDAVVS